MEDVSIYLLVAGAVGWIFALFLFLRVKAQSYQLEDGFGVAVNEGKSDHTVELIDKSGQSKKTTREINATLEDIYTAVREGADSFLMSEYKICLIFVACFEVVVIVLVAHVGVGQPGADSNGFDWAKGGFSGLAFGIGALCSICTGYVSMKVAVFSNARTAVAASAEGAEGWRGAFSTAMNAGGVAGFLLCATAMMVLFLVCNIFNLQWSFDKNPKELFEAIAGFGLGGSTIAMFGRVGGGIFTKAADVGSDLAGKVVAGIPEDDPRNPGVIADNVGDNVGDVAGMGSDLFGSFAEASCAALIVGASSPDIAKSWNSLLFPLVVSATGIFGGVITHFFATDVWPVKCENDVLRALKVQLGISTLLVTASLWPIASYFLPATFEIDNEVGKGTTLHVFFSIAVGLWGGCLIGFVTEYFTSYDYKPTQEVAQSTETGAATNIIYGIALGYKSAVIPILILCIDVYVSFSMLGMYGVALCALGMLSTLSSCLTIDVYGPICDNGGGFAEMAEMHPRTREKTDALDAAGNTTAAIGKGFAIGSAALVSLALLGAFVTRVSQNQVKPFCPGLKPDSQNVSLLQPVTFAMLICGAMIPYWFSAMTMKSVGKAAMDMVKEVARQFRELKGLLEGTPGHEKPQHGECIRIATQASLREMILPGALVIFAPLLVGTFLGVNALVGFLSGSLCSGVQIAVSMSNTGGAWDNAKKYVEKGKLLFAVPGTEPVEYKVQLKGSDAHKAAVVGDTVGDPFKDTSGPAINIVMKLMAILSLVFADFFMSLHDGRGILDVWISC